MVQQPEGGSPTVKLVDFGLSAFKEPTVKLTEYLGTPYFMSPEIVQKKPYDKKIDIWGIGVICYFLVTGELPFVEESTSKMLEKI